MIERSKRYYPEPFSALKKAMICLEYELADNRVERAEVFIRHGISDRQVRTWRRAKDPLVERYKREMAHNLSDNIKESANLILGDLMKHYTSKRPSIQQKEAFFDKLVLSAARLDMVAGGDNISKKQSNHELFMSELRKANQQKALPPITEDDSDIIDIETEQ